MEKPLKVVTFGEIMLRLSPPHRRRFVQTDCFDATFGGGEANVAASLANYGLDSYFVTKLPAQDIGQACLNHLRRYGIKTDYIVRGGERLGIYFLEYGASQRGSKVIYDRAHSSVNTLLPAEVDWEEIFQDADWFHWTGITPALGKTPQRTLHAALEAAKGAGVTISCDLNFRGKLWSVEEARLTMRPLMDYVDICIANEEDADRCLGLSIDMAQVDSGRLDIERYCQLGRKLKETYDFEAVAITLRESFSASKNGWSALLHDDKDCQIPYRSNRYEIDLVDRVGGGDSFAGALIYGLLEKDSTTEAIEFAAAASCLKQTIPGDFNLVTTQEVEKLTSGSGSGRVDR